VERLERMKDLGVIFDSELNFVQQCNTAKKILILLIHSIVVVVIVVV